jgi:hypothetical protein
LILISDSRAPYAECGSPLNWNQALQRVKEIEIRIQSYGADEQRAAATPAEFAGLAEQLDHVWNDPRSDAMGSGTGSQGLLKYRCLHHLQVLLKNAFNISS